MAATPNEMRSNRGEGITTQNTPPPRLSVAVTGRTVQQR